jgi:hypothetical protein
MPRVRVQGTETVRASALILLVFAPFSANAADRVGAIMDDLAELSDGIESDLLNPIDGARSSAAARKMAGLFDELVPHYDPRFGGDEERWRSACERGRDLALALSGRLAKGDWAAAREMMSQNTALKLSAHRTFRPGFWRRFRRIFGQTPVRAASENQKKQGEEQK